jgi:glyoxylase-like metal-dependent hydrolase (beta-lactamase superfamily II)
MKKIKISENVLKLKSWYGIPISVWLVKDRDDIYLVDAGVSLMSKEIIKTIKSFGNGNLKAIFLIHGHPNHVGGVTSILKKYDVPVYIGNVEIKHATGEVKYLDKKKKSIFR